MSSIVELEELIARLTGEARGAARRIFKVTTTTGTLIAPAEMEGWITKLFGSLDAVRSQRIVRVTNLVTLEGALFNELRELQQLLVRAGFNVGKVDGIMGQLSRTAVKTMQIKYGLPADSWPTAELLARMRGVAAAPRAQPAQPGAAVIR